MVYKIEEVGELIEELDKGSTLFNSKLYSVKEGVTSISEDWGTSFTNLPNNITIPSSRYNVHFAKDGTMFVSKPREFFRSEPPYTDFTHVLSLSTTMSIVNKWGFTEDDDGVLYIGEYANYPDVVEGGYVNVMYWYKSLDSGKTWTKYDNLQHTDTKHFHQIKFNSFDQTLYITTGDAKKLVFTSTNKGETWEELIPTTYPNQTSENINYGGHTGMGFFETGEILWGTDWQPRNPDNGEYWNWFVRSKGDDVNSFVYQKMEKKYYGMAGEIVTDPYSGEAWITLRDEFGEDDVHPVLMYSKNKGVSWEPLIELPAIDERNAGTLIAYADTSIKDSPYIFWEIINAGVFRFPRSLQPEIPEVKPSNVINEVEFFINQNNKIHEVELFNREGTINNNSHFVGN